MNTFNLRKFNSELDISELTSEVITIELLIEKGFIAKGDADYLIRSINEGKNIIITGKLGTGKTTLLKSLLSQQNKEIQNVIDIDKLIKPKSSRFVINEIRDKEKALELLIALDKGSSVIATNWSNGDWQEPFLRLFEEEKENIKAKLSEYKFIVVQAWMNINNERKIKIRNVL